MVYLLRGAIRNYAWGSRTAIAELTGRSSPTSAPEAELWLGAHPSDPAWVQTAEAEQSLLDWIDDDPHGQLGSAVSSRFGGAMPFLAKVLAADEPLSLQAHPSSAQAIGGYERESERGLGDSDCARNYRDRNHKPELVIALTRFDALAGFRTPDCTAAMMRALGLSHLDPGGELCSGDGGLRTLLSSWFAVDPVEVAVMVGDVVRGARAYLHSGAAGFALEAETLLELGERYPADAGVLAAVLLNRIQLHPGQSLFIPAGNLHAYLHGVAVEVMANSDNVLRGGLTAKHVDVPELLKVLDFTPASSDELRAPLHRDGIELVYDVPVDEFAVSVVLINGPRVGHEIALPEREGPEVLLCTAGSLQVRSRGGYLTLQRGDAAWCAASDPALRILARHPSTLFRIGVPACGKSNSVSEGLVSPGL